MLCSIDKVGGRLALTGDHLLQVEWVVTRDGESVLVFSGGLPQDITGAQPSITVLQGEQWRKD